MTKRLTAVCLFLGVAFPPHAAAQGPALGSASTLEVLLQEVRQLRMAIEKQGAMQAHVGLLMGRLTLQDQRVARSASELKKFEERAARIDVERQRHYVALRTLQRQIDAAVDEKERSALTEKLRALREQRAVTDREDSESRERLRRVRQALELAEGRYAEIEGFLDHLDRKLYIETK